jgi:hypothetical protein
MVMVPDVVGRTAYCITNASFSLRCTLPLMIVVVELDRSAPPL